MKSVQKGNEFEIEVLQYIENELKSGKLPVNSNLSKVFCKKGYYSRDRGSKIEIDISIESYLPNSSLWSTLWIFECKHYSKRIPVDDLEELHSKRQQIACDNSKAVLVTNSSLQKSALTFARSNGIGVVRLLAKDQVTWELPFIERSNVSRVFEVITALTDPNFKGSNCDFYACDGDYVYNDLGSLLGRKAEVKNAIPDDLAYIIPSYIRHYSSPSKTAKKLQNRLLYKHIQTAYEYVRSKQLNENISSQVIQNIYVQPLSSIFSSSQAKTTQNQKAVVSTGSADSFFVSSPPLVTTETQAKYISEFENDSTSIIPKLGVEAYALYLPIHFFFSGSQFDTDWGIYISEAGIAKIAFTLKKHCYELFDEPTDKMDIDATFTRIAYQILLRHELFHFKLEFFALNAELILGNPIYVPYIQNIYAPTQYSDKCLEEAFANSSVLHSGVIEQLFRKLYNPNNLDSCRAKISWHDVITKEFFDLQPQGYSNYALKRGWPEWFDAFTGLSQRQRAMNYLCNQILSSQLEPRAESIPFYAFPPDNFFLRAENLVPINIVRTLSNTDKQPSNHL